MVRDPLLVHCVSYHRCLLLERVLFDAFVKMGIEGVVLVQFFTHITEQAQPRQVIILDYRHKQIPLSGYPDIPRN